MTGHRSSISCFDQIFNKANTENYNLSIRFQPDGLFYSFFNPEESKYIGFESVLIPSLPEFYTFIEQNPLLRSNFKKVFCIVPSRHYTIIPSSLFLREYSKEYLPLLNDVEITEVIKSTSIFSENAELVYGVELAYMHLISEFFNNACVLPGVAAFIDFVLFRYRSINSTGLFLNLNKDNFDLLMIEQGKMKFCNNFNYKAPEDLVYYTIFVADQMRINVDSAQIQLFGDISTKSDIIRLLKKYLRTVNLSEANKDINLSYALSEIQPYRYPDLFNPRLCEL